MLNWPWIVVVVLSSVGYLLLFRKFTLDHKLIWWIPILLLAAISFYGFYQIWSNGEIGVNYGIINGAIIVLVFLGGIICYNESLSYTKGIGLSLIILGIILLSIPRKNLFRA